MLEKIGTISWQLLSEIWNRKDNHDRSIFSQLDAIMSEEKFKSILHGISRERYSGSQSAIMDEFVTKMSLSSFSYVNKNIETKRKDLYEKLFRLQQIRERYFARDNRIRSEDQDYQMIVILDIKYNDDEREYSELSQELAMLIENVQKSYSDYRKSVKHTLFV